MNCRHCDSQDTTVLRSDKKPGEVVRRRKCSACGHEWATTELHQDDMLVLRKAKVLVTSMKSLFQEMSHGTPSHR